MPQLTSQKKEFISDRKKLYYSYMLFLYKVFNKSNSATFLSSVAIVTFNLLIIFIFKNTFTVLAEEHYKILIFIFAASSLIFYLAGIFISIKAPKKIDYYKNKLTKL